MVYTVKHLNRASLRCDWICIACSDVKKWVSSQPGGNTRWINMRLKSRGIMSQPCLALGDSVGKLSS